MELKDRYTDLYENSPAMYFSLDTQGKVIECNQTMLSSLQAFTPGGCGPTLRQIAARPAGGRLPGALPGFHGTGLGGEGNVLGEAEW